jgi:hypothetical protein
VGGEERGYDGGKKVKGRKRHLLVDTEGFVLKAKVHSAKVMDYEGIKALLEQAGERLYDSACFVTSSEEPGSPIGEPAGDLSFSRFAAEIKGRAKMLLEMEGA